MQPRVLLIFIDGLGIGEQSPSNPLYAADALAPLAHFKNELSAIPLDGITVATDPRLGVEGRPQSATGQTTILTGVNAPKLLGFHKQGFPNQTLRDLLNEHSIFRRLRSAGFERNVFANTFTPRFFTHPPRWKSASTCAVEAAGLPFRKLPDLLGGHSLFHDFTNDRLIEQGFDVPRYSPGEAAAVLARLSEQHSFTMFEHFITDKIGHDRDEKAAGEHLPKLAAFVRETVRQTDLQSTTVILTSDHGNIEDLSVRNHTLNDVPTVIWGRRKEEAAARIRDLSDISPVIFDLLTK